MQVQICTTCMIYIDMEMYPHLAQVAMPDGDASVQVNMTHGAYANAYACDVQCKYALPEFEWSAIDDDIIRADPELIPYFLQSQSPCVGDVGTKEYMRCLLQANNTVVPHATTGLSLPLPLPFAFCS